MNEPAQEQIKEFWERYEYTGKLAGIEPVAGEEEGKLVYVSPPIDLNNLFKYAVPIAVAKCGLVEFRTSLLGSIYKAIYDNEDPALALFWALWQVKEKDK